MIAKYFFLALIMVSVFLFVKDQNVLWGMGFLGLILLYMLEFSAPSA